MCCDEKGWNSLGDYPKTGHTITPKNVERSLLDDGVGDNLVLVPEGSGIRPTSPFMLPLRIHEGTIDAARESGHSSSPIMACFGFRVDCRLSGNY